MKTYNEIVQVKDTREPEILEREGVTGVDVGYKYVDGKKTDELAIRVYVQKKKPPAELSRSERIPKTMNGVKTDVIERTFVLQPYRIRLDEIEIKADTNHYDPLKGGTSIGPCRAVGGYVYAGTLGAIVKDRDSGDPMLLSNFHVMCVDDGWSVGDDMTQPSRVDGGHCPADTVGALQRASLAGSTAGGGPGVDCAVASHDARDYACEIIDIGEVKGVATATVDMPVRKRGRTTGLTYGTVDTVDLTVKIDYGDGLGDVTLTKQIGIDVDPDKSAKIGDHGDSGSVVVNDDNEVVGLYFAGSDSGDYGVANPIQAVLDALNVEICTPVTKKVEIKEFKEKPEKLEIKEFKEKFEKVERKEFKEFKEKPEKVELKEFKDIVEKAFEKPFDKNPKELVEGPGGHLPPVTPVQPWQPWQPAQPMQPPVQPGPRGFTGFRPSGGKGCIDFSAYPPAPQPNPWLVNGTVRFFALDHLNNPWPNPGIKDYGGFVGLDCGFTMNIQLPSPCNQVMLKLVHFSRPAKVIAFDSSMGYLSSAAMSGPQGVVETLTLTGPGIVYVRIEAPQNETLLQMICCDETATGRKPPKEWKEGKEKELKEWKEWKEMKEWKEKDKIEGFEGKDFRSEMKEFQEGVPQPPVQPLVPGAGAIEERLARIEAALAQMSHFISAGLRPDLSEGALKRESDPKR